VTNYGDDPLVDNGTVSRINISALQSTTIAVGRGPWGIAAIFDEAKAVIKVYVANAEDNTVTVITDEGNRTTTRTLQDVGFSGPTGVAVSPDGRYAYVANYAGGGVGSVAVIRTQDDKLVHNIGVGRGPWGVAAGMQAGHGHTFVTNSESDSAFHQVAAIRYTRDWDRDEHTLITPLVNVGFQPLGAAAPRNGNFAYVINGDATISKVTLQNQSLPAVTTIQLNEMEGAYALGAFIGGRPPAPPSVFTATATAYDRVALAWTDNSTDDSSAALGFKIERRKEGAVEFTEIIQVPAGTTTYRDTPLQSETTYEYRIRAYNEAADSAYVIPQETPVTTEKGRFSWCFIGLLLQ
jgi:YVTN family beta-propeller protein